MRVQAFVQKLPIEALQVPVLHRTTGLDELPFHVPRVRPLIHRPTPEFRPVVQQNPLRQPSGLPSFFQDANAPQPRQRPVRFDPQKTPRPSQRSTPVRVQKRRIVAALTAVVLAP